MADFRSYVLLWTRITGTGADGLETDEELRTRLKNYFKFNNMTMSSPHLGAAPAPQNTTITRCSFESPNKELLPCREVYGHSGPHMHYFRCMTQPIGQTRCSLHEFHPGACNTRPLGLDLSVNGTQLQGFIDGTMIEEPAPLPPTPVAASPVSAPPPTATKKVFASWKCRKACCPDRAPKEHPFAPICYTCGEEMEKVFL